MRIGIDIDDCITQTVERYCDVATELFDRTITKDQLLHTSGKLEAQGMVTAEEFQTLRRKLTDDRFFQSIYPHAGSIEAVKELSLMHEVFFITSRDDYSEAKEDTFFWMEAHGIIAPTILFSSQKDLIIKENAIDIFIDDRESYVAQAIKAGAKPIFFAQPWNKQYQLKQQVFRFESWGEIVIHISNLY
jgi:uncharacterized HAD superfamily protein